MPEPTQEEIEAVARAIHRSSLVEPGAFSYETLARAAILALDRVRGIVEVDVIGRTK